MLLLPPPTALLQALSAALPWSGSVQRWILCGSASGVPPALLHCRKNPLLVPQRWGKRCRPQQPLLPQGGAGCPLRPSSPVPVGYTTVPRGAVVNCWALPENPSPAPGWRHLSGRRTPGTRDHTPPLRRPRIPLGEAHACAPRLGVFWGC